MLEIAVVAHAFEGIKIAVGILIFNAAIKMLKKMHKRAFPITVMSCSLVASLVIHFMGWHISSLCLILLSGLAGYIFFMVQQMKSRKGGTAQ